MFFKSRCYNKGNHHNFKPRYNETHGIPGDLKAETISPELTEALKTRTKMYKGDVCGWCGKVVNNG